MSDPTQQMPTAGGPPAGAPPPDPPTGGGPGGPDDPGGPGGPGANGGGMDRRQITILTLVGLIVVLLVILLLVVLSGDDGDEASTQAPTSTTTTAPTTTGSSTTTSTSTTTTTTTTTSTTTTTTSTTTTTTTTTTAPPETVPPERCTGRTDPDEPEPVAQVFYEAWTLDDVDCAEQVASEDAIDTLFAADGSDTDWVFEGCETPDDGESVVECTHTYDGGAAFFDMLFSPTVGWQVEAVRFEAA